MLLNKSNCVWSFSSCHKFQFYQFFLSLDNNENRTFGRKSFSFNYQEKTALSMKRKWLFFNQILLINSLGMRHLFAARVLTTFTLAVLENIFIYCGECFSLLIFFSPSLYNACASNASAWCNSVNPKTSKVSFLHKIHNIKEIRRKCGFFIWNSNNGANCELQSKNNEILRVWRHKDWRRVSH